ncbi:MAG: acyl-CoA dehydrogenase [Euryarchaeota archaeon]|nr:acyl-CoA dehydrogenase [Euryarchaeota archaeon]
MKIQLTDEQELIRRTVREFAEKEVAPKAAAWDKDKTFPAEVVPKMAALGLMGMPFPQELGGAGTDMVSYCIAIEELARADASVAVTMSVNNSLYSWPLYTFGDEEQHKKWLTPHLKGEKLGAYGLSEPGAGSDVAAMKTRAEKKGDSYVLNGQKSWITNGGHADSYVVFAKTDPEKKHRGISAFLLAKDTPGFTCGKPEDKLGIRASSTTTLHFDNVEVPEDQRIGDEGIGFKIAMQTLDGGRLGIASQATGIAQAAFDHALSYAKERKQFGQAIGRFQAIQGKLADMAMKLEASRMLTYRACDLRDRKEPHSKEAAMAKLYASEAAMSITREAVQVYGGNGYMSEFPLERYMRDAKITEIYEGTSEIQRIVIARRLLDL